MYEAASGHPAASLRLAGHAQQKLGGQSERDSFTPYPGRD